MSADDIRDLLERLRDEAYTTNAMRRDRRQAAEAIAALLSQVETLTQQRNTALADAERAREERNRVHLRLNTGWLLKLKALDEENQRLRVDTEKLTRFVGHVLKDHRNDGYPGDVDGAAVQDWATACGLIEERVVDGPCNPAGCSCSEYAEWPMVCYFNTQLGKDAIAAVAQIDKETP